MVIAVIATVLADTLFAISAVFQQSAASTLDPKLNLKFALIHQLFKNRRWVYGFLISLLGYAFQIFALSKSSLLVVQPLIILNFVIALPLSVYFVQKRNMTFIEIFSTSLITLGLVGFLLISNTKGGISNPSQSGWIVTLASLLASYFILGTVSVRVYDPAKSVLQALMGGIANVLFAVLAKSLSSIVADSYRHSHSLVKLVSPLFLSWEFPMILAAFYLVLISVQSAFQGKSLGWSLPTLTVINPIVSLIIGLIVLHETQRNSPLAISLESISAILCLFGIFNLARIEQSVE
ncbi:MAG: DMT family transporter [Acidimicrobiales bacterium]|nr:DMT family transporter [Acidimicrobiales bacterium]